VSFSLTLSLLFSFSSEFSKYNMAHTSTYTSFSQYHDGILRPTTSLPLSYTVDEDEFRSQMSELEDPTLVGILSELSQRLHEKSPEYTSNIIFDNSYICNVEFAGRFYQSTTPRESSRLAMQDAAGLAICEFLSHPEDFINSEVSTIVPAVSMITALSDICKKMGWKVIYDYDSSSDGWRCAPSIVGHDKKYHFGYGEIFENQYDAKKNAAGIAIRWLME